MKINSGLKDIQIQMRFQEIKWFSICVISSKKSFCEIDECKKYLRIC